MVGKLKYLGEAMMAKNVSTGSVAAAATEASTLTLIIESDNFREVGVVSRKLANHAINFIAFQLADAAVGGHGIGSATTVLKFLASFASIYLLILDRTNWRTNMLTSLLIPYIFLSLPSSLFSVLRGEVGKWIAFIAVVLRLFFPHNFPDWLEMPGSLILLLVVSPHLFAQSIRDGPVGVVICSAIACYLLQEHIRASGGFRNSFAKSHGISNTLGIILLLGYPIWRLAIHFF